MASDEGTASLKPPLMRSKRKASSHMESKEKKSQSLHHYVLLIRVNDENCWWWIISKIQYVVRINTKMLIACISKSHHRNVLYMERFWQGNKLANLANLPKCFFTDITDTPKMYLAYGLTVAYLSNFSSPIAFICMVHQNFSPPNNYFPCTVYFTWKPS